MTSMMISYLLWKIAFDMALKHQLGNFKKLKSTFFCWLYMSSLDHTAMPFVPPKDRSVYSLYSSKWFEEKGISNKTASNALHAVRKVWTLMGPWYEPKTVTLQTLYDVFRIEPDFSGFKSDLELLFSQLSSYVDKKNYELPDYIGHLEDMLAHQPDDAELMEQIAGLKAEMQKQ